MGNNDLRKRIALGVILIVVGISFLSKDYIALRREKVFSAMNLELTELLAYDDTLEDSLDDESLEDPAVNEEVSDTDVPSVEDPIKNEEVKVYESYVGILEISKIKFSKGFYKRESSLNNVKYNIKILPQSSYPDQDKGNVIIIGHSGNYNNSYFRNLYKLELDDTATIKYNGKLYTYKVVNIYTDTKDGTVVIYRDETKNCLTLITCTKDDKTTQTIYIFELVSVI